MGRNDHRLMQAARDQHGVVSHHQLLSLGLTPRQIDHRAAGVLLAKHRGVFVVGGAPPTWRQDVMAACLAVGPTAVASHRAAAVLWELRGFEHAPVEVTSLRGGVPRVPGVRRHTTDVLGPADRDVRDGIPVTSVARTLLDLGAVVGGDALDGALEDARQRRLVTHPYLWRTLDRLGVPGRRGVAGLRAVLEAADPSQAPTESALEDRFLRVVRRFGHPEPARQVRVDNLRLDFHFDPWPVVAELNGAKWHSSEADRRRDRRRANRVRAHGLIVCEFTWNDVRYWPYDIDADLTAAFAAASTTTRLFAS